MDIFTMRCIAASVLILFFSLSLNAQTRTVTGVVKDQTGMPLKGVTVKIKGAKKNSITDETGKYAITVDKNTVLVFSFVGYSGKEIPVGESQSSVNAQLDALDVDLNDVVVVGYGTQKKINTTGAIETISHKALQNRPVTSASALLQGLAPSLVVSTPGGGNTPGSRPTIQIRGQGALSGITEPLVVIDGIPSSMTDFNALNPNVIESISILKDAAASAIYGARAPYGVLVVTTKMGKKNEKPVFAYNGNYGIDNPVRMPHTADSYTFALARNQAQLNGNLTPYFTDAALDIIQDNIKNPGKYSLTELNPTIAGGWGGAAGAYNNNDILDEWIRPAFRHQHDLSVKGGGENTSYFVSAAFVKQPGILNFIEDIDNFKRYNINGGLVAQINDRLKFSYRTRYALSSSIAPSGEFDLGRDRIYSFAYGAWPTIPIKYPTGEYSGISRISTSMDGGEIRAKSHRFDNILGLDLDIMKGWTAHVDGTWRVSLDDYQKLRKPVYETGPTGVVALIAGTESSMSKYTLMDNYGTLQGYTTYEHNINKHTFRIQVGAQVEEDNVRQLSGTARDLIVPDLAAVATATGTRTFNDAISTWATSGFFGRINYNFDEKYLFELNGRYDGSGRYSKDSRWGFFPSASVGWNMSNENFWKSIEPVVNRSKLRASYGTVGNQGNSAGYLHIPTMTVGNQAGWIINNERLPFVNTPGILNMERTWEKLTTFNIALELGLFNNRLSTEFDYFNRKSWDIIGPATPLPSVLGTTAPEVNNAEFVTKGWEFQMRWNDDINKRWNYSVGLNLGDNMSKVTKYNTTVNAFSGWYVGKEFGEVWGFTAERFLNKGDFEANGKTKIDQSVINAKWYPGDMKYEDLDGDGKITRGSQTIESSGDLRKIGNSTPRYRFGFNLALGYSFQNAGRVDVSAFFEGIGKRDLFMGSSFFYWGAASGGSAIETAVFQGKHLDFYRDENSNPRVLTELGQNTNAYFPRPYGNSGEGAKNFQTSTRYLMSGAYLRCKNLQVNYTLPNNWLNTVKVKNCSIYFSAENLFVVSELPAYIDPEFVNGGRMYPQQAVYSMGVNIGF
ncbi:TonB-dependent receptor [Pedobacter nyackensis]|uniref:SusC/RagA family TonB-linked outer membrane protein n=1 Tax=Pedobacter nyackensis TaxID=475255 RepID=UPI00292D08F9|nr:TonB-dependent receptor [Pedobacter nyackensis]